MNNNNSSINRFIKNGTMLITVLSIFACFYNVAVAGAATGGAESLATVVQRVESNIAAVSRLLILISYVAGVGFAMAGVLQFKAHKDNPTQVPLSKPIVYVCVGAFLLFLPKLMSTAGKSIFGADSAAGPTESIDISNISSSNAG